MNGGLYWMGLVFCGSGIILFVIGLAGRLFDHPTSTILLYVGVGLFFFSWVLAFYRPAAQSEAPPEVSPAPQEDDLAIL